MNKANGIVSKSARHNWRLAATVFMVGVLAACNSESDGGSEGTAKTAAELPQTVVVYDNTDIAIGASLQTVLSESETWEEFPNTELAYDPTDDDDNGTTTTVDIRSRCLATTYTLEANPKEVVLYDIDGNLSWPGALLQGDQYRNGTMRLLSVDPSFRESVSVVVSNLYTTSNVTAKTIENPSYIEVSEAIKSVIAESFGSNIPTGSSTHLEITETKDLTTFFMKAGFSGKTGFGIGKVKATLSASIDASRDKQNLVIQLTQKMFDVELQQPPKPEDWFTDSFFTDELPGLISNGEISDANPPVYVAKVTYGRMVTATISSTASSTEIEAMIQATYDSLTTDATASLSSKYSSVWSESEKSLVSLGGNGADATSALNSGNWNEYFSSDVEVTEAVPLMVTFKNLYDNSTAGVTETTEYTDELCEPYIMVDGTYDFTTTQTHTPPEGFSGANAVKTGHFNDDDILDLVWNNASGSDNQVYVMMGTKTGTFDMVEEACAGNEESGYQAESCFLDNGITSWSQFDLYTGDLDGDGHDDLIWANPYSNNQTRLTIRYVLGSEYGFLTDSYGVAYVDHGLTGVADDINIPNNLIVQDVNGDGMVELSLGSAVYDANGNCEGESYAGWLRFVNTYSPSWSESNLTLTNKRTDSNLYCNNDMTLDEMEALTQQWFTDVDLNGKTDRLANDRGVSLWDTGSTNNLVKTTLLNGFSTVGNLYLDTDSRSINHSGHSLKDRDFWQGSLAKPGVFTSDGGAGLVWLDTDSGDTEAIYWSQATSDWKEADRQALFDWTANGDMPDLTSTMTDQNQLLVVDVNDDQYDDISFLTTVASDGGSLVDQLWFGTALSAKQSGSNAFFDAGSVNYQQHPVAKNWAQVNQYFSGKFDSDTLDDVILVQTGSPGKIYVARAKADDM